MIYIAYIFSAFFWVNAVPHFVSGVTGQRFQSPFASPPGKGESAPVVNALWGSSNFVAGYLLLAYAGFFEIGLNIPTGVFFGAALATSVLLAVTFDKIRNA